MDFIIKQSFTQKIEYYPVFVGNSGENTDRACGVIFSRVFSYPEVSSNPSQLHLRQLNLPSDDSLFSVGEERKKIEDTDQCKDLMARFKSNPGSFHELLSFHRESLRIGSWINPALRVKMARVIIEHFWLDRNFSAVENILLDCITAILRHKNWMGVCPDFNKILGLFYEMRGHPRCVLPVLDVGITLSAKCFDVWSEKIKRSYTLPPSSFEHLLLKFRETVPIEQVWNACVFEAKYYHLYEDFKRRDFSIFSIFQVEGNRIRYIERNGGVISALEELAISIGESSFLEPFYSKFIQISIGMKILYKNLPSAPAAPYLLYQELGGASLLTLQARYDALKTEYPDSFGVSLQYIHFLIRKGDFDAILREVDQFLFFQSTLQAIGCTVKKDNRFLGTLTCVKVDLFTTREMEGRAMEAASRFLEANPMYGSLFLRRAKIYLNPLSAFYNVDLAKKDLDCAQLYLFQNLGLYSEKMRLGYILEDMEAVEQAKMALELNYELMYGIETLAILKYPDSCFLNVKIDAFDREIRSRYSSASLVYKERLEGASLEDTWLRAREIFPEMTDEDLYSFFSGSLEVNVRNISKLFDRFNPSQKHYAVLRFPI